MTTAAQRGTTTVTERAVRRIAERAADESLATAAETSPAAPADGRPAAETATAARTAKAAASVHGRRARVALDVALPYPAPLTETVRGLQERVTGRTRELTGLDVPPARIRVTSLTPARGGPARTEADPAPPAGRTPRRLWSRRRVPAAVQAALAAAACAALAVDLVLVHAAHRPAAAWRVQAVHWLAQHGPADRSVTVAGALTALLGGWLIVLAVTPGLRRRATVRVPAAGVVAAVDRPAVEALVRDAVGAVPGVGTVRVRTGRRRVVVRAGLLFGESARVRDDVTAAAGGALASCALRRPRGLRVRVTPSPLWQAPAGQAEGDA
ncbi:DUF6286 domain-containing protein [Streptomyces sp. NPDC090106]|uniref:DUF6286 domain-containing protein n=1 Tax=Streptomyces sp. NPDC090106 TaxID=3365946 RepID=UPI0037F998C8